MTSGFLLEQEPQVGPRTRRAEWIELRLTALRLRLLALTHRLRLPLGTTPAAVATADVEVARLDQARRERLLWRVHDTARVAHRAWESGDDPSVAMRDLSVALARMAEFDC